MTRKSGPLLDSKDMYCPVSNMDVYVCVCVKTSVSLLLCVCVCPLWILQDMPGYLNVMAL